MRVSGHLNSPGPYTHTRTGYALSWMSANGYFPLEHIVHVDPDRFKQMMPEWDGYVARNLKNAGTMYVRICAYVHVVA